MRNCYQEYISKYSKIVIRRTITQANRPTIDQNSAKVKLTTNDHSHVMPEHHHQVVGIDFAGRQRILSGWKEES